MKTPQKGQNKNIPQASKKIQILDIVNHKRLSITVLKSSLGCSMAGIHNVEDILLDPVAEEECG